MGRPVSRYLDAFRFAGIAALAVAVSACRPGTVVTELREMGSITGRLQTGLSEGPERITCDWIEDSSGRRVAVFWPDGWEVRHDPVRLVDDDGRVVAEAGDALVLTGPVGGIGESMCAPGKPFLAETVERVGDPASGESPS